MTRIFAALILALTLAGCNQSSEPDAPATTEQPADSATVVETPEPEAVEEAIEETPEQIRARLAAQMPDEFARLGMCLDPRPEICTQNYAPVCGVHEDGSRQTYSNGCTACSNPEVVGALPEACPE